MAPALAANFTPATSVWVPPHKKWLVIQSASRHAPLGLVGSTPSGLSSGALDGGHSILLQSRTFSILQSWTWLWKEEVWICGHSTASSTSLQRMGRSCRRESLWILGLLISITAGQNTTRAPEYQPEGCLRWDIALLGLKLWSDQKRKTINLLFAVAICFLQFDWERHICKRHQLSTRCGQPCLQAAENTLLPCITAAVGEATMCKYLVAPFEVVQSVLFTQAVFAQRFPYEMTHLRFCTPQFKDIYTKTTQMANLQKKTHLSKFMLILVQGFYQEQ